MVVYNIILYIQDYYFKLYIQFFDHIVQFIPQVTIKFRVKFFKIFHLSSKNKDFSSFTQYLIIYFSVTYKLFNDSNSILIKKIIKTNIIWQMKYLSTILIFLIFSFALFLQFQARTLKHLVDWGHYNSDSQPRQINNNWMSRLSDNLYIGSMSIPGTHDSGTWPGRGGDAYQCQSWNIYYQLKAGIRFLDIRIGYDDPKKLNIYHSNAFQGDLQVALNDIIRFLRQNPKEFIMMLVAHEWGPFILQNNQKRLQQLFKKLNFPYYYSEGIPRLGLVRGKVWILKNTASFPLSMKTFQFINDKTNFNPLNPYYYLQNNWEASVDQKVKYSKQLIQRTCQPLKLKINFLNIAFSFFGFPYTYAKKDGGTNESIQKFLKNWRGCVGILIMDFPGTNLIRLIINNN